MNQKPVMRLEGLKYALVISLVLWWGDFLHYSENITIERR